MDFIELKYGCNPHQKPSKIYVDSGKLPLEVLNGTPGYINFLDTLNGYQLVKELKEATGLPAAASFKHVSPAGAAVGLPLDDTLKKMYFCEDLEGLNDSPIACAYARARGTDRMSSFGDFVALSDTCDLTTAKLLKSEISDGIIAPDYTDEALEILKAKKRGTYAIIKIDPNYVPEELEVRQVYGIKFLQGRNNSVIDKSLLENIVTKNKNIPDSAKTDLLIALITLKYTQSNSVCYAFGGQTIGVGAGQQSRIHCTRLAGDKADVWQLRRHEKVQNLKFLPTLKRADRDNLIDIYITEGLSSILKNSDWRNYFAECPEELTSEEKRSYLDSLKGVSLGSDAFFPFSDNIERAYRSGVSFVAQPGGSVNDSAVIEACDKYGMVMAFTGLRLFHH